jgi:N6-adenosine-specific RNA methylase IME4
MGAVILVADDPFASIRAAGPFDLIMADPPWSFVSYSAKGETKGAAAQYACMTLADIMALPVAALAARNAWLLLWTTNPCLRQAFDVLDAWGFVYSSKLTWVKSNRFGTGHVVRGVDEPLLIARRGQPQLYTKSTPSVFHAPAREHSRKPDAAYRIAETMFGSYVRRADLFSRESRPGWTGWGLEATLFDRAGQP